MTAPQRPGQDNDWGQNAPQPPGYGESPLPRYGEGVPSEAVGRETGIARAIERIREQTLTNQQQNRQRFNAAISLPEQQEPGGTPSGSGRLSDDETVRWLAHRKEQEQEQLERFMASPLGPLGRATSQNLETSQLTSPQPPWMRKERLASVQAEREKVQRSREQETERGGGRGDD